MATTTLYSQTATDRIYSITELALNETSAPIDCTNAIEVLFHVDGATFGGGTISLTGSIDGTNYAPLPNRDTSGGFMAATAADAQIYVAGAIPAKVRVNFTGGAGGTSGVCWVLVRSRLL